MGRFRAAWGRGKVAWGGVGLSRVEYHGTDAQASLTSGRRPSGVGGYVGIVHDETFPGVDELVVPPETPMRNCARMCPIGVISGVIAAAASVKFFIIWF